MKIKNVEGEEKMGALGLNSKKKKKRREKKEFYYLGVNHSFIL